MNVPHFEIVKEQKRRDQKWPCFLVRKIKIRVNINNVSKDEKRKKEYLDAHAAEKRFLINIIDDRDPGTELRHDRLPGSQTNAWGIRIC